MITRRDAAMQAVEKGLKTLDDALRQIWPDKTDAELKRLWFSLPLAMRKQFWKETTYGRDPPSADLMERIKAAVT